MQLTEQQRQYLIKSMCDLLDEYNYNYTLLALNKIIDEWWEQKQELIEAFTKHPNYVEGQFMIAFSHDYKRGFNKEMVRAFKDYIIDRVAADYVNTLPPEINQQRLNEWCSMLPSALFRFIDELPTKVTQKTVTPEVANELDCMVPQIHVHNGERASRVINRLFQYLGYDKHPDYNREFAKFADALNPLIVKRHTVLSLNPLDYLTMSFGNSWASCHTIDKANRRGMPDNYSGCYSSGTISYMLDGTSMVLYTVDASYDGNAYWTQPKVNRQMFHYAEDKLVQGRLYPQSNDGDGEVYTPYRQIVQEIMATIFDFPNLWKLHKGTDAAGRYIYSHGTHYRDYECYSSCTLSIKTDSDNYNNLTVGADPICIECGSRHSVEKSINCCSGAYKCSCCGCSIDEDDVYWVGDEAYCGDCVTYCDSCDEYEASDDVTWIESEARYVCSYCRDRYYACCDDCGEWFNCDNLIEVSDGNYVCRDCIEDHYVYCGRCETYHHIDYVRYVDELEENLCDDCYEQYINEKETKEGEEGENND